MFLLQRVFWHGTVSAGQCWQPWAVGVQEVFGQWVCILGGWELDSVILVIPSNWGCSVNLYGAADWTNYCAIFFCFVFNSQGKKQQREKYCGDFSGHSNLPAAGPRRAPKALPQRYEAARQPPHGRTLHCTRECDAGRREEQQGALLGSCSDHFRRRLEALPARGMSGATFRGTAGVWCLRAGSVK